MYINPNVVENNLSSGLGETFGEVALVADDVRTASVIANESAELIVIDLELYNRSISKVVKKEFEDKIRYISDFQYFHKLAPKYRRQLAMACRAKSMTGGDVVVQQGDDAKSMYFIRSYEFLMFLGRNAS